VNIQEYISSGIIESYVLGLASAEERIEFEQMCAQYPELVEARNNFELAIEEQTRKNAIPPPTNIKEKIWSALKETSLSNTPKIITMEPTTRRSSGWSWVAAASIILLLAAGYFAFTFYNQTKELKNTNNDLQAKVNRTDSILNKMAEEQKIMSDPNVTVVNMVGTQKGSPSSANIYWDSTSANVYLIVKNLPQLPSDKQYQLWSIINGQNGQLQPNSLGLFDVGQDQKVILKMSNVKKADAFAITIENRGNTGGPNLQQLQSMGKAKL
jgi:anti-sigma-K factor RskA